MVRKAGMLASGKGAAAVLHLAALAITARGLGAEAFGILALVHTTALTAGGLAKFQSWQAAIQFGTPALGAGDRQRLGDVLAFCVALDLGSGILAMLAAMALLPWLAPTVGIPPEYRGLALAYLALVPTMAAAAPTGVLRLLDRFDLMAWQSTLDPALRLAGVAAAWAMGAPFWVYAAVWFVADVTADLVLFWLAWREVRRRRVAKGWRWPGWRPVLRPGPGAWPFVWANNLSSSLATAWGPASALVVGAALGPAAAGTWRIALTITEALAKPADLLGRAFYPEIAKLRADGRQADAWSLSGRAVGLSAAAAAVLAAAVALLSGPVVHLAFGADHADAAPLLALMALSLLASVPAFPFEAVLLAHGRATRAFLIRFTATLAYAGLLAWAATAGLQTAGWAYVAASVFQALLFGFAVLSLRRNRA